MERQSKLIKFPIELIKRIEQYQKDNCITSFSAAVYELVRLSLSMSEKNKH